MSELLDAILKADKKMVDEKKGVIKMDEEEKIKLINMLKNAIPKKKKQIEEFRLKKEKYMNGNDIIFAMEYMVSVWEYKLKDLENNK